MLIQKDRRRQVRTKRQTPRPGEREGDGKEDERPEAADAAERITEKHRELWAKVKKKLISGLRKKDPKEGIEELKAAKTAADVLTSIVRGERQAWGIDATGDERLPDDTEEIVKAMASLTVPSGTDTALDGK